MFDKQLLKSAFIKTIPVLCSYIFLGIAYGITMHSVGFSWYWSVLISLIVYTGAFQFVLITFLSNGVSLVTLIITALLMNSRQSFYALTFLKDFNAMGRRKLFMIHTLTDETYAVDCTLGYLPEGKRHHMMFWVALFNWIYWSTGSLLGGIIGELLPFDLEGIDFCMTALFVIIFVDQWERLKDHKPAICGLIVGVLCLILFGQGSFMLPALLISSLLLILSDRIETGMPAEDKTANNKEPDSPEGGARP